MLWYLVSLLIRTLILSHQGPTLMTSFNLDYLLVGPISIYRHGVGEWWFRASVYEF